MKTIFFFSWLFFLCKFLFFLLASADTFKAPVYNGYQIVTLVSSTEDRFNLEAESWSSSGLIRSPAITDCDKQWVLGGPDALQLGGYFTTEWNDLPTHDIFYFSLQFMLNGLWSSTDIINLVFDSKTIPVGNINTMSANFFGRTCDGTQMSTLYLYVITGKVFHSSPSLTMKIVSALTTSPNTASFGSRGLYILFANKSASDTESYCFKLLTTAINIPNRCPCNQGLYDDPSNPGSCISCPTGCRDCFGGSLSQCYSCASGYSYVNGECIKCDVSCKQCSGPNSDQCITCNTNLWLYWDGTCRATCTSETTRQIVVDDLWVCELPCPEGQFMLWNDTCVDSCESPLRPVRNLTGVFCEKPCDYNEEFYYKNGSCYKTCDLPFVEGGILAVEGVEFDVKTCFWKCETAQYMLWNWTCWNSCDDPLVRKMNETGNFCFKPCEDAEFLFGNGSCGDSCEFPFKQGETIFDAVSTCEFLCDLTGEFLFTNNASCVSKCEFPFLVREGGGSEGKFCDSPCERNEYILADRSCSKNCTLPYYNIEIIDESASLCWEYNDDLVEAIGEIIKGEGKISYGIMMALSIGKMGSSMSLSLASLAKMLEYVKYMRISYSQRLELMFQLQGSSELSLSFEVPLSEGIQEKFPDHELPWNFEEYELGSSFFLNYWETFASLLVVLAGVLILSLIDIVMKKRRNLFGYVVMWLKNAFKWNFFLMIFCSNFEGVVFFTSLEVRTLELNSFAAFVSFIVCVVGNIVAVAVLLRISWILRDIRRRKYLQVHDISAGDKKKIVNPYRKWKSYQVLFLHCNEEKPIQQAFFVVFLVRVYLFHLTIGYLFTYPLAQSIIITCLSVLMLAYLIILRPLEEKLDLIKLIITELIILTVNLCVLVLAVLDHNGKQTNSSTELFSSIIIMTNLVFNNLALIFLAVELINTLVKIYKEIRKHKLKGITSLLEIFMMIFAGEAMAMEEEYLEPEEEGGVSEGISAKSRSPQLKNSKRVKIKTPPMSIRKIKIEIPHNTSMKNDDRNSDATPELLKYQSLNRTPKSPDSLVGDGEGFSSAAIRSLAKQNSSSKTSEVSGLSLFFDGSMRGLDKRRERILARSERASAGLLSLSKVKGVGESMSVNKVSPVRSEFSGEDSKLL